MGTGACLLGHDHGEHALCDLPPIIERQQATSLMDRPSTEQVNINELNSIVYDVLGAHAQ
jgi:hypothetical protein